MHEFHSTYTRLLFCTFPSHWQFFLMLKKEITFLNYIYFLKQVVLKSLLNREIVQTILLYQNNSIYIFSSQVFDLWLKNLLSRELTLKKKKSNCISMAAVKPSFVISVWLEKWWKRNKARATVMVYLHLLFSIFHLHASLSWVLLLARERLFSFWQKWTHWTMPHALYNTLLTVALRHTKINISTLKRLLFQHFTHRIASKHLNFMVLYALKSKNI